MYLYEIYVTNESLHVNSSFTYYHMNKFELFTRVKVKFNRADNVGLIVKRQFTDKTVLEINAELGYKVLQIEECIDEQPVFSEELYKLAEWMSFTTVSPMVSCINAMLPKALRTSFTIPNVTKVEYIHKVSDLNIKTPRQKEVYEQLIEGMFAHEARKISVSIIQKLVEFGAIEIKQKEKEFINEESEKKAFKTLTDEQLNAYNRFLETEKMVSLLFGVTGSGKTEVYLHLARYYLSMNKEVLILVPEISLTPQMIARVKERFSDVIFYHSELSDQERYEQYKRVLKQEVKIVVGTRSSIFLPFHNLGCIIIDEEHDSSYKQDNRPCYSARNVAIRRAHEHNAKVLLASATPSLDSYTRALRNEFELLKLKNRINLKMPEIELVNLNDEIKNHGSYIISRRLKEEIGYCLEKKKQAIILMNRRGYSPIIKCLKCGNVLMCEDCDTPLNYHKDTGLMVCHSCSRTYKKISVCPGCGNTSLSNYGFGTERVEEEIRHLFPSAKTVRMDRDTTTRKGSHKRILESFERKEADILIGTQMISKGLDYPDVTLVGILNADAGLMHQDYNSSKVTFDLLMQASGRSGRSLDEGKVLIQIYNEDHYVIKAVVKQDYEYFFNIEMNYRQKAKYPPYSHIIAVYLNDTNENRIIKSAEWIYLRLKESEKRVISPLMLGRLQALNRCRVLVFSDNLKDSLAIINNVVKDYIKEKSMSNIQIDIDPLYLE